jgi:hypothetical protein
MDEHIFYLTGNTINGVIEMPQNNLKTNKSFEDASNKQQKLANAINSVRAKEDNLNNEHNTKKEAMGANIQR